MTCGCSKPSLGGGSNILMLGGKRRRKNSRKNSKSKKKNSKSKKKKKNSKRRSIKKRVRIMSGGSFLMGSTMDGSETTNPLYMASKAIGSDYSPQTFSATDINRQYVT